MTGADSIAHTPAAAPVIVADPAAPDTVAADTVAVAAVRQFGVVLESPAPPEVSPAPSQSYGVSFIFGGLSLLFCIIGLRFRNNRKYVGVLWRHMFETRTRSNIFDETVRESTYLFLLNLLWSCSTGILLWVAIISAGQLGLAPSLSRAVMVLHPGVTIAICMGTVLAYSLFMALSYLTAGWVFTDTQRARLWLKGHTAAQALTGFIYLPLALLALFYPGWGETVLYIALLTFVCAKLVFIWKGFRIFFNQTSSWVLFLYYLCSLEIVPLILAYLGAETLCGLVRF